MSLDSSRLSDVSRKLNEAVAEAEAAAAEVVAEAARTRVPVRTGRLRDAIHVEKGRFKDVSGTRQEGVWVIAGDREAFYGHMVEHGHKQEGGGHVPAHPFLTPAFEETRSQQDAAARATMRTRIGL